MPLWQAVTPVSKVVKLSTTGVDNSPEGSSPTPHADGIDPSPLSSVAEGIAPRLARCAHPLPPCG